MRSCQASGTATMEAASKVHLMVQREKRLILAENEKLRNGSFEASLSPLSAARNDAETREWRVERDISIVVGAAIDFKADCGGSGGTGGSGFVFR